MDLALHGRPAHVYTGERPFDPALPSIVFLHGAQNDHSVWGLQSRGFARHGWSVLAPDVPGHGGSDGPSLATIVEMADWVAALLGATGAREAVLVGHGMGSLIALALAMRGEPGVRALALLGTALPTQASDTLLTMTREVRERAIDMITAWSSAGWAQKPQAPGPGAFLNWGGLRLMQRVAARHGPEVLARDFAAVAAYGDGGGRLGAVRCPCLLIAGARDQMTPSRGAAALARQPAGSRTVVVPAGHGMMSEAPDAVLDALIDFTRTRLPAVA